MRMAGPWPLPCDRTGCRCEADPPPTTSVAPKHRVRVHRSCRRVRLVWWHSSTRVLPLRRCSCPGTLPIPCAGSRQRLRRRWRAATSACSISCGTTASNPIYAPRQRVLTRRVPRHGRRWPPRPTRRRRWHGSSTICVQTTSLGPVLDRRGSARRERHCPMALPATTFWWLCTGPCGSHCEWASGHARLHGALCCRRACPSRSTRALFGSQHHHDQRVQGSRQWQKDAAGKPFAWTLCGSSVGAAATPL
ncbi:hypothetical protein pclt_cds_816 [Pandoravirus celtis]|uniref:Uncharacterized protein n=1 Tax=Pandoravirus celtis TaxID=2568002 RepID=A0A4D6EJB0_9VIRU|nr:hypothetical protein pclt_cds_816 [Pandoravirus celtis]